MKNKSNARVRHNPKKEGRPRKIGVEKGFGPRHAANAKEGDLTQVDTDTVPAMLTPREAVLNRNAAEMAGRGNIEELNERGNKLAERGVDLASGDKNMKEKAKKMQGGGDVPLDQRNAFPNRGPGGVYPSMGPFGGGTDDRVFRGRPGALGQPPEQIGGFGGGLGARDEFGRQFSARNEFGGFGAGHGVPAPPDPRGSGPFKTPDVGQPLPPGWGNPQPIGNNVGGPINMPWQAPPAVPPPGQWRNMPSSPFYPPGQGLKMAQGEEDILGNSGSIYGNQPPVQLNAPGGLGDILKAIQAEGQKQGLTAGQISGLLKAFQGMGGGGGMPTYGEGSATSQALGPALEAAFPSGYQGGISDIGYPPFVAPSAQYHADKGGWVGPYDSLYMIPAYQRGMGNVPG